MPRFTNLGAELVIVSPHLDDAAFSCAIVMHAALKSASVLIVNIFTRSAYAPFAPEVEERGIEAVTQLRRQEELTGLDLFRRMAGRSAELTEVDLGLFDAPLRLRLLTGDVQGGPLDVDRYEREVEALVSILQPILTDASCVLLPLGLGGRALDGHVDHCIARDAGRRCVAPERIAFYEDLPYAGRMLNEDRESAIRSFTSTLVNVQASVMTDADAADRKRKLAQCYASQVDTTTMEEMAVYTSSGGGERIYAATAARGFFETFRR